MARMEPWRNSDEASALNDADKAVEMVRQIGDGLALIVGALGVLLPIVSAFFAGRSASPAAQICKAARLPDVTVVPTTPKGPTKSRRRGSRAAFVAERERQRPDRRPLQTSRLSKAGPREEAPRHRSIKTALASCPEIGAVSNVPVDGSAAAMHDCV